MSGKVGYTAAVHTAKPYKCGTYCNKNVYCSNRLSTPYYGPSDYLLCNHVILLYRLNTVSVAPSTIEIRHDLDPDIDNLKNV